MLNKTGVFKFPSDGLYNNSMECTWQIQAPPSKVTLINLEIILEKHRTLHLHVAMMKMKMEQKENEKIYISPDLK